MRRWVAAVSVTILVVGLAAGAALGLALNHNPSEVGNGSQTVAESPSGPEVDYGFSASCDDHETRTGHDRECRATVSVQNASENVEMVKVVGSTNGGGFAESWVIVPHEMPYDVGPHATADRWGTRPDGGEDALFYGDWVTVTAVTSDGRAHVLEQHQFSCRDVAYKDACEGDNARDD